LVDHTDDSQDQHDAPGVSAMARWLPLLFALALMAMAYWAASTWMGAESDTPRQQGD
jgi:hypothetical protein